MDGRRGLVPSNYMTKLVGEDLMEFHQSMVVGTSVGGVGEVADDGWSTSIPQVREPPESISLNENPELYSRAVK